jgi:hypothetical protein
MMAEAPDGYVPATTQAHAQGLLVVWEAAKLLDMRIIDLVQEMAAGRIEITARCNNLPCVSLQAIDAYRRSRVA